MTGVIVINKPQEFTSFDVVAVLRKILKEKKLGHTGTLDPMATGVLPILVGKATKACDLLPESDKSYIADFRLGIETDTGDIWGNIVKNAEFNVAYESLSDILENFRGDIFQIPPMYSAVSVGGTRLYKLARQGIEVEREKRPVFIKTLELLEFDGEKGKLKIECSKGTYIRTLIEDIAKSLGTIATMTDLIRIKACGFSIEEAVSIDDLREMSREQIEEILKPVEILFESYSKVYVSEPQAKRFLNGGELSLSRLKIKDEDCEFRRVYSDEFLGLAKIEDDNLKFVKHFVE